MFRAIILVILPIVLVADKVTFQCQLNASDCTVGADPGLQFNYDLRPVVPTSLTEESKSVVTGQTKCFKNGPNLKLTTWEVYLDYQDKQSGKDGATKKVAGDVFTVYNTLDLGVTKEIKGEIEIPNLKQGYELKLTSSQGDVSVDLKNLYKKGVTLKIFDLRFVVQIINNEIRI